MLLKCSKNTFKILEIAFFKYKLKINRVFKKIDLNIFIV